MILFLWYGVLILVFVYSLSNREGFSQGIQYIRIVNSTQTSPTYIQINELMAFDENGTNVALGKPSHSSVTHHPGYSSASAVDNSLTGWFFHSGHPPNTSDFWEVNLEKEYKLSKIEYYNRSDCCQERIIGCTMLLLDKNRKMVRKFKFKNGEMKQEILFSDKKKANPAVRDRIRWL